MRNLILVFFTALLAGCACGADASSQATSYAATDACGRTVTQSAYTASTVITKPATRAAIDGADAPGPQEIIGVYIPFLGTGLALRGGLIWDGAGGGPITIPIGGRAASAQNSCAPPAQGQWVWMETPSNQAQSDPCAVK